VRVLSSNSRKLSTSRKNPPPNLLPEYGSTELAEVSEKGQDFIASAASLCQMVFLAQFPPSKK
jgi:hypothetical protein